VGATRGIGHVVHGQAVDRLLTGSLSAWPPAPGPCQCSVQPPVSIGQPLRAEQPLRVHVQPLSKHNQLLSKHSRSATTTKAVEQAAIHFTCQCSVQPPLICTSVSAAGPTSSTLRQSLKHMVSSKPS